MEEKLCSPAVPFSITILNVIARSYSKVDKERSRIVELPSSAPKDVEALIVIPPTE